MQLGNLFEATELRGLSRITGKPVDKISVEHEHIDKYVSDGWTLLRKGIRSARLSRPKALQSEIPDRIWTLLYKMGFSYLSGKGGAKLICRTPDGLVPNQIGVVSVDDDVALYIECRTAKAPRSAPKFGEDIAHIDGLRKSFGTAIRAKYGARKIGALYWGFNVSLSENDLQRAADKNVRVFNDRELKYYEDLVAQIGTAARYQFLADVFGASKIESLSLKVPAIRISLGNERCYSFAISPERLLKIAYVSHRAKGSPTDVDTYQRLIRRARIKDIREYISTGGYFPTNIVLNIRARRPMQFDKAATPANVDTSIGEIGWLTLPSEYKAAWVIDGQHRLFAYADAAEAQASELTVLAFENLDESDQARLFIDINAKQKSVKQNLLVELFAELHWNSEDPADRVTAIIAKLILTLDSERDSPFYKKIVRADDSAGSRRSISLKALSNALEAPDFFLSHTKAGSIPGAFWQDDQLKTLKRAAKVLNLWFTDSIALVRDNWDLGKEPGGVLGMNDSVVASVNVLRSVLRHLTETGSKLWDLTDTELITAIQPWAQDLSKVYAAFSASDMASFRSLRGIQGQTQRYRELQLRLQSKRPAFTPEGLAEYARSRDQNTINDARTLVDEIERMLQKHVVGTLKAILGEDDAGWWYKGVPKAVRTRIVNQLNDEGSVAPKESRFNFIDYRTVALDQWSAFKDTLGRDKANASKERRTAWIGEVNEIRNRVSHASKGASATPEDVQVLREQLEWLKGQLSSPSSSNTESNDEPMNE